MARYLTRLWDDHSRIAHQNARDFDAREADTPKKTAAFIWQTVRAIREGRKIFRMEVSREAREAKRRKGKTQA